MRERGVQRHRSINDGAFNTCSDKGEGSRDILVYGNEETHDDDEWDGNMHDSFSHSLNETREDITLDGGTLVETLDGQTLDETRAGEIWEEYVNGENHGDTYVGTHHKTFEDTLDADVKAFGKAFAETLANLSDHLPFQLMDPTESSTECDEQTGSIDSSADEVDTLETENPNWPVLPSFEGFRQFDGVGELLGPRMSVPTEFTDTLAEERAPKEREPRDSATAANEEPPFVETRGECHQESSKQAPEQLPDISLSPPLVSPSGKVPPKRPTGPISTGSKKNLKQPSQKRTASPTTVTSENVSPTHLLESSFVSFYEQPSEATSMESPNKAPLVSAQESSAIDSSEEKKTSKPPKSPCASKPPKQTLRPSTPSPRKPSEHAVECPPSSPSGSSSVTSSSTKDSKQLSLTGSLHGPSTEKTFFPISTPRSRSKSKEVPPVSSEPLSTPSPNPKKAQSPSPIGLSHEQLTRKKFLNILPSVSKESSNGSSYGLSTEKIPPNSTSGSKSRSIKKTLTKSQSKTGSCTSSQSCEQIFQEAIMCLQRRNFEAYMRLLTSFPQIVTMKSSTNDRVTLLHIMGRQNTPPSDVIILKTLSEDPTVLTATDAFGNTPLHCAASVANEKNITAIKIFVKFHPKGASQKNLDGNLPIHLIASSGNPGSEVAALLLVRAYKEGVVSKNKNGQLPVHLACTDGSDNEKCLRTLLSVHKARNWSVSSLDNEGNSPLHSAICYGSSSNAFDAFHAMPDSFMQKDRNGSLPIHAALRNGNVTVEVIRSILSAAPFAGRVPGPDRKMPVKYAIMRHLDPSLVKNLLASDMPIEIGGRGRVNGGHSHIVYRQHGHSWWHAAIEGQDKYLEEIKDLLSAATLPQILALARSTGPNGRSITEQASPPGLAKLFQGLLCFYDRYEVCTDIPLSFDCDAVSFHAIDTKKAFDTVKETVSCHDDNCTAISFQSDKDDEVEVSFLGSDVYEENVRLKCYMFEDDFLSEKEVRKKFNISAEFCESIIRVHRNPHYKNNIFNSYSLFCVVFEYPQTSLVDIFDSLPSEKSKRLASCRGVLKKIARAVRHLHDQGLVHGHLEQSTISKYKNKWKLMEIGNVTPFGSAMGGKIRRSAPPEAVLDLTHAGRGEWEQLQTGVNQDIVRDLSVLDHVNPADNLFSSDVFALSNPTYALKVHRKRESHVKPTLPETTLSQMSKQITSGEKLRFSRSASGEIINKKKSRIPIPEKNATMREQYSPRAKQKSVRFTSGVKAKSRLSLSEKFKLGINLHSKASKNTEQQLNFPTGSKKSGFSSGTQRDLSPFRKWLPNKARAIDSSLEESAGKEIIRLRNALKLMKKKHQHQLAQERVRANTAALKKQGDLTRKIIASAKKELGKMSSSVRFAPETCVASPTWDIWSFGVVMVQLLTSGECNKFLPSSIPNDDIFLQKLGSFDKENHEKICQEVNKAAGTFAADLVGQLLNPTPRERMTSMKYVLKHKFFNEKSTLGGEEGRSWDDSTFGSTFVSTRVT